MNDTIISEKPVTKELSELLQTAHDYGTEKARYYSIHFAEWIAENRWLPFTTTVGIWAKGAELKTTFELYQLFEDRNDWKTAKA